ncbi:MAG: FkbM family methyltransferase [Elusimicrobia bacterium]|nr:FkbM family methyltransferase [Elusimicrobiota bacterium]
MKDNFVAMPAGGLIVDMGANVGNFSVMALASHHDNRVIAVEANENLSAAFWDQMDLNDFPKNRIILDNFFLGNIGKKQEEMIVSMGLDSVETVSLEKFFSMHDISRINLLKCDIEGGEFGLFSEGLLLEKIDQIVMEVHYAFGDKDKLFSELRKGGFSIRINRETNSDCVLSAKKY